jgi:dihydropteroate synthase
MTKKEPGDIFRPADGKISPSFLRQERRRPYTVLLAGGRRLELGERTLVMAVINITPDSFAESHPSIDPARALDLAQAAEAQGADILDLGAESTRPGSAAVEAEEELRRLLPALRAISSRTSLPVSIDTTKAAVARAALDEGAAIVNDISGLRYDSGLGPVVAGAGAGLVLMHMRGTSRDMYSQASYQDVAAEVRNELADSIEAAMRAGVSRDAILVDPGLGFAKRAEQSFEILARLPELAALDRPILVGSSRKSFLARAIGDRPPAQRDWGTAATVTAAVLAGAHVVRVHSVAPMVEAARVTDEILRWRDRL